MSDRYNARSIFKTSILGRYVLGGDLNTPDCITCFNNEVFEALRLYPIDITLPRRREDTSAFILKVLIYVGVMPGHYAYGLVARMIKRLADHPGTDFSAMVEDIAKKANTTAASVLHNIESNFDVNDSLMYDRVTTLTKTKPLTARDMLADLAQYVRYSMLVGDYANARFFRQ